MQLTTLSNQFVFTLPTDFLPAGVEAKYAPFLKKNRVVYANVLDYLSSTIKEVVFPASTYQFSSQVKKRKKIQHKAVENIYDTFTNELEVVFRSIDSNLNYFIILDALLDAKLDVDRQNDSDMFLFIVDRHKDVIMKVTFRSAMFKSLSDCKFSYAEQAGDDKTFTLGFAYNYLDIEFMLDGTEIVQDITARQLGNNEAFININTGENGSTDG